MANKISILSEKELNFLLSVTAKSLPSNPSEQGWSAERIKKAFYKGFEVVFNYLKNTQIETQKCIEEIYIDTLDELDKYTEYGIFRFNYKNTEIFHLFVNVKGNVIIQNRTSNSGYYYRDKLGGYEWNPWKYNRYSENGVTKWEQGTTYGVGAIVTNNNKLYVSLTYANGFALDDNNAWMELDFLNFVRKNDLNNYIPKEEGKGLSSNDYTNEEKAKVSKSVAEDDLKTINGESIVGSGNIEVKGADVDLSNYYDIPTANVLLAAKEDKANLKALAYKDSLTKTDVGLGNVRNVESYSKTETDEKITDVVKIAEGKTNSYVLKWLNNPFFESNEDVIRINLKDNPILDYRGDAIPNTALKIGDIFYIIETNVPDRWLAGIDRDVYVFAKMETSKVNLDEYYNKTEISGLVKEYDSQLKTDIAEDYYNKTETDALLPKTIDLTSVELTPGEMQAFPDGTTYEDFENANAVSIFAETGTMILPKVAVVSYEYSNAIIFSISTPTVSCNIIVDKESNQFTISETTGFNVSEFFYWDDNHNIQVRGTTNEGDYTYHLQNLRIKLNGINHDTFTEDTENRELDLDAAIDNKITSAINNRLNTELAKINKAIEEDY